MRQEENRVTFFARLEPVLAPTELERVRFAYITAKYSHRAQRRKEIVNGEPLRYFEHCRRTAIILMDELCCHDWEIVCAALLHDILEDSDEINPLTLEVGFGPRVTRLVRHVSKVPKEGYYERLCRTAPADAIVLKGCDRLDNVRSLVCDGTTVEFVRKQTDETERYCLDLLRKTSANGPTPYRDMAAALTAEMERGLRDCRTWLLAQERRTQEAPKP